MELKTAHPGPLWNDCQVGQEDDREHGQRLACLVLS